MHFRGDDRPLAHDLAVINRFLGLCDVCEPSTLRSVSAQHDQVHDQVIEPEQMGITLMHEHALCDLSCRFEPHAEATRKVFGLAMPPDASRIRGIARLIEAGWIDQVTLSHDICLKMMRVKYGGWGYAHILTRFVPRFRQAGITDSQIETIMVSNPRRLLPFVAPQA
jgi:predicted metal-dependent phosphotriesterase family hydrolase